MRINSIYHLCDMIGPRADVDLAGWVADELCDRGLLDWAHDLTGGTLYAEPEEFAEIAREVTEAQRDWYGNARLVAELTGGGE